jgi:hypothetical protein
MVQSWVYFATYWLLFKFASVHTVCNDFFGKRKKEKEVGPSTDIKDAKKSKHDRRQILLSSNFTFG